MYIVLSANGLDWIYTATKENEDLTGDKITIQATDLPDNLTKKEQKLYKSQKKVWTEE